MRENRLRTLLSEGKPSLGTRLQSTWPTITELVGRSEKFDYVEFLAEYAPYDLYALDNLGRAIDLFPNFTGLIKMERSAQHHLAVRAMAAGIQNLLFTDVRTAADAEDCVRIVRPETPGSVGTHGMAGGRAASGGPAALVQEYGNAVIVLMIEKKDAVENLEAILAVPGIDMVQFGPSDYSMSIGQAGQRASAQIVEAREHTIKTALKLGVQPRGELTDASEAEYYLKLGVKHFCMAADTTVLSRYYAAQGAAMREALGGA
ncbi:MAG TPA: aldolase/citrate lyase family protein [Chloroflexota bacterium]|nr:aldolase/citrate lyase family protein [Chloroflexota bacterium]